MSDRKFSDPTTYDISIDWDDAPDGGDGGYDRHGNRVIPSAMMELVELRKRLAAAEAEIATLRDTLVLIDNRCYQDEWVLRTIADAMGETATP